jgi:fructokinase
MTLLGGVEGGGTKFVCAVARNDRIVERTRIDTRDAVATYADVRDFFAAAAARHGAIEALGIGTFGPIELDPASPDYGRVTTTPKPGWRRASVLEALAPLGLRIALDTDVNAAALGEWAHGAGQGCGTVTYTTIGTGIGVGVVRGGVSVMGMAQFEIGHIRAPRDPAADAFPGVCAYHGDCFEGLAAGPAVLARWGRDLSAATPEQVRLIAGYAGKLAALLALAHAPHRQVLGGGVSKAPGFLEATREAARAELNGYVAALPCDLSDYIVAPALGDDAGITGALELARRSVLGEAG